MSRLAVFFAQGYEEIEALTVIDICRRGGLEADMVSVTGEREVTSSHGITVKTDKKFEEADFGEYDMLVLPGGMPGTKNLEAHEGLMAQVDVPRPAFSGTGVFCRESGRAVILPLRAIWREQR